MREEFRRHGLNGNTKHRVFEALFARQQGKCFICGYKPELYSVPNAPHSPRNTNIHYLLYIDHCHTTGMIRGLLCCECNTILGWLENRGFKPKPDTMRKISENGEVEIIPYPEELFLREIDSAGRWLDHYKEIVFRYMQRDRWLPRKDILFHIQIQEGTQMSGLNGLNGHMKRLEEKAPMPTEGLFLIKAEEFVPKLHLLSAQERAQLDAFIARVQPLLDQGLYGPGPAGSRGYPNMSRLSNADLEEWRYWDTRGKALEHK